MNDEGSSPNNLSPTVNNRRPNRENAHGDRTALDIRPQENEDLQERAMVTYTREEGSSDERIALRSAQRHRKRTPCYSRTCPVTISHPSSREKMVGLAIIDDQAGRTYVDPLVARNLKLPRKVQRESSHGTITIEGESAIKPCHVISGLRIAPLIGQKEVALPEVIMQNEIPDSLDQIPSRKEVEETPGFSDFAQYFPEKQNDWETILLIGRDCMEAMWQEQYYSDENRSQMVAKTPLGWTLIGSPPEKDPPTANRRQPKEKSKEDNHARTMVSQEREPNFCIIHTNPHNCAPDHHTRECEDFVELSPTNKWMIVNKERICPLCIVAQHEARKCPLRNGGTITA